MRYLDDLLRHLRMSPPEPGVHHVEVQHEDDCGIWNGRPCDCSPVIETGITVHRKYDGGES